MVGEGHLFFDKSDIPQRRHIHRDYWVYQPPAVTDVKEVWFAGVSRGHYRESAYRIFRCQVAMRMSEVVHTKTPLISVCLTLLYAG